jgi:phospholipase/lecithinase/hemolysin
MKSLRRAFLVMLTAFGAIQAGAAPYGRLYVFGDSYSDFGAGYIDSNGPTAVAYLAWNLGLEFTHARAANNAAKSIDFAVSGAKTGEGEGHATQGALLGYGMMNQVRDFATRVHSGEIHFDPASTLFFIAGGLNDKTLPTATTVANLRKEIEILQGLGGRHFTLALLPTQIPTYAAVGQRLNPAIAQLVQQGRQELGVDLWLNHWGADYDEVMEHPAAYGIVNTTEPCAGRDIRGEDTTPRGDPATYFYYHHSHPSTAVHRIVGRRLGDEVLAHAAQAQ